jgi:DNA-binding response OmpR family regulator
MGAFSLDEKTILIVDDDKNICELLNLYLSDAGFDLLFTHDGSSALNILRDKEIDLILLDIMLPVINGWEVCKMVKAKYDIPVIMLTARDELDDKIQGFDAGADDYIVKPFQPREVLARIRARLRYASWSVDQKKQAEEAGHENFLSVGSLTLDMDKYEVTNRGKQIELKPKEVQLLYFLLKNRNMVFSRDQLLEKVWNYDFSGDTRTVDVHIKSLREKLDDTEECWSIKTIWGVGYKLEVK